MVRRDLYKSERQPSGYTYGEAEVAVAAGLNVETKHRGLLRARLKNLQRLGLPGTAPGKGARARYTRAQISQWLLAMMVADIGIDPTIVVQAVKAQWKALEPWIPQATDFEARSESPVCLAVWPDIAAGAWRRGGAGLRIEIFRSSPRTEMFRPSSRSDNLAQIAESARDGWVCLINFTRPSTRLENALPPRG